MRALAAAGITTLAWLLVSFLVVSFACGLVFAQRRRRVRRPAATIQPPELIARAA